MTLCRTPLGICSIAIQPLGCGNGGLNWDDVRPRFPTTKSARGARGTSDFLVARALMSLMLGELLSTARQHILRGSKSECIDPFIGTDVEPLLSRNQSLEVMQACHRLRRPGE
jgi:hypothetical protein